VFCSVSNEIATVLSNIDHANGTVRTVVSASGTADTGLIVDHDLPISQISMDGAGRALDHANRIFAMHAGVRDHDVVVNRTVAKKSGIVIVCCGAGADTVVASSTTIHVDQHCRGAIDESSLHKEFNEPVRHFRL
jgi:hypothetical protein